MLDVLVIGAGQAGLATVHHLNQRGITPTVIEAGPSPTGSWSRFYDSLTLFSPARHSGLPGLPFDGDPHRYPTRDEVVGYLRRYAERLSMRLRLDTTVTAVTWRRGVFRVHLSSDHVVEARSVVSAAGGFGSPHRPALPGLETFTGQVLHSAQYRRPDMFAGARVVVVGAGSSAVQIAVELADLANVSLTSRQPVRWVPQRPLGRDFHDWLHWTRIQHLPISRILGTGGVGVLDDGRYRAAVQAGRPLWRPLFTAIEHDKVIWPDGSAEAVDAIVLATGYRPQVAHLRECQGPQAGPQGRALTETGAPRHRRGLSTTVPGLGFVGLERQRGFASATLRGVGPDALFVVRRLGGA